jgi:MFS family permease
VTLPEAAAAPLRGPRSAYPVLLVLGVVDAAAYSVIAPVLPAIADATDASTTTITALAASFPLAMLVGLAVSGAVIRRGRGHGLLLVALALLGVGSLAFVVTDSLAALFLARAVMGVGSGALWMGITFRAFEYWPGQEYRCMSRVYAAYSVGALVGPGLGALPGAQAPFVAYALLLVVVAPFAARLPRATTRRGYVADRTWRAMPGFWYAAAGIMLGMLAVGMIDGVLPLHFATAWTQTQIGLAYVATATVTAAAAVAAGGIRPGLALAAGGVAATVGVTLAGASSTGVWWMLALALTGAGAGLAQTGSTGALLERIPTHRIVGAMTAWSQLGITGYLLAPALGGPLAERWGYAALGVVPLGLGVTTWVLSRTTSRREAAV